MKLTGGFPPKTGKCRICGKPTKLLIHQTCGEQADANNAQVTAARRRRYKQNQKKYAAGFVPRFADK